MEGQAVLAQLALRVRRDRRVLKVRRVRKRRQVPLVRQVLMDSLARKAGLDRKEQD